MLFLSKTDMQKCMGLEECVNAMEKAYKIFYDNAYAMPHRLCIENGKDTLLYMPCFIDEAFGTKFLTLFPDNTNRGKPMIDGMMVLNDPDDGSIKAIMHAGFLTALRTGANTAVMLKTLAPGDADTCGIVGAGMQGVFQTAFTCFVRDIKTVYVYSYGLKNFNKFKNDVESILGRAVDFVLCDDIEEVMKNSDIILTATTSNNPVYPDKEELFKDKTLVAIGSYKPDCRECPDALFRVVDNIYVDLDFAKEESGELGIPLAKGIIDDDKILQISDVLYDEKLKAHIPGQTVFIKTVGMALFDIVCAGEIYKKAIEKNIGIELDF